MKLILLGYRMNQANLAGVNLPGLYILHFAPPPRVGNNSGFLNWGKTTRENSRTPNATRDFGGKFPKYSLKMHLLTKISPEIHSFPYNFPKKPVFP